jgi:aminoglycoside phosphotransferase (APT) family kinase protein
VTTTKQVNKKAGPRSRYYDAILKILDNDIKPELTSVRALYAYKLARKQLARLAALNDYAPFVPESLASLHSEAEGIESKPLSTEAFHAALIREGQLLDDIESATDARLKPREQQQKTAESSTALPDSINTKTVENYLRATLDPKATVSQLRILSGGRSKQTILFTMTDGAGKEIERVIRRDLSTSPTGGSVPEEYAVLKALADRGTPVPRPLLCEPDASTLGSPFIVVEKVSGALAGHIFEPPSREAVLDSARVLGRLHALPVAEIAPTLREQFRSAPDATKLRGLVLELQKTWNDNARAYSPTIDFVFKWLLDNVDSLHPATSIVHGDYSFHNILFEGDKLTAVLDWELVRVGHPAEDLGYIRPGVLNRMSWDDFMAAYREGGGPEIDPKDQLFYTLLEKLRLIIMLFKVRGFVDSGVSDDIELVDAVVFSTPRLIHQASVELRNFLGLANLPT